MNSNGLLQTACPITLCTLLMFQHSGLFISAKKSKVMHINKMTRTSATTEADVTKLNLVDKCESCTREFTKLRGLKIHMARWCDGGRTQRSRIGSLTDKAVKSSKRGAVEASLDKVIIASDPPLENVPHFEYLGSTLQGDGSDEADVRHRLEIAQSPFSSLSHLCEKGLCARPSHTAARHGPSIEP